MGDISARRPQNDPVRLGVYKHYKHRAEDPKYYQVIGVARHSETEELVVVYVPLYPAGGPRMAVRPLDNFTGRVEVDDRTVPRFEYMGIEIPDYSI